MPWRPPVPTMGGLPILLALFFLMFIWREPRLEDSLKQRSPSGLNQRGRMRRRMRGLSLQGGGGEACHVEEDATDELKAMKLDKPAKSTGNHQGDFETNYCFVLIPEDASQPMQELWAKAKISRDGMHWEDDFIDIVTRFYKHRGYGRNKDVAKLALQLLRDKARSDGQEPPPMSSRALRMLEGCTPSELHSLALPCERFGYVGVSLYADDLGQVKELRRNERATQLAIACGKMIEVLGDAFVTRVFDDQELFMRHNFTLKDCSSDANWLIKAKIHNIEMAGKYTPHHWKEKSKKLGMKNASFHQPIDNTMPTQENEVLRGGQEGLCDWEQTWEQLELSFNLTSTSNETTWKSDVKIDFSPKHLKVVCKGNTLFDRELSNTVRSDECTWFLMDGTKLAVSLEKVKRSEWHTLCPQRENNSRHTLDAHAHVDNT